VPRSTSKTESPARRRTQPQPPPPEVSGEVIPIPDVAASGPPRTGAAEGLPKAASGATGRTPRARRRAPQPKRTPPRLADTAGPEPGAPPAHVRLTVGTILGPHGVNGEFKLRLQTDDPEHLLTLKRVYLGEEKAPRTVLGARMHAGNALMRLQGISSPETVDRFRGTPLRIRGADARPLAPDEYYLYQVIGLDAFDEAGNRLGRVTDLLETGANDVLVITPDEGADILLPSHPEVVVSMEPSAGKIIVRPLTYYGE
jgi:16S rRNA processing protein RimM